MKKLVFAFALGVLTAVPAFAADLKTDPFQVTGEVTEVTDTAITVMKGKERHHIARDKDTKIAGDLKVGSKVTIKYQMIAVSVEVKTEAKKK